MTAPAPCPDCDGRGFNYSDPDHRKIICTSCDGPEDGEEEKMSKQGPFDKAIEILKWALDNSLASQASPETAHQCKSLASAIRVLEAVGKINKDYELDALSMICEQADVDWEGRFVKDLRRLIEALPDKED